MTQMCIVPIAVERTIKAAMPIHGCRFGEWANRQRLAEEEEDCMVTAIITQCQVHSEASRLEASIPLLRCWKLGQANRLSSLCSGEVEPGVALFAACNPR